MKHFFAFIFSLFLVVIMFGCSPAGPNISDSLEVSFQELIVSNNINKSFQIYIDSNDAENLKYGSDIKIAFKNVSGEDVFFEVGYGIKLYIIRDNAWVEIQNKNEYYGEGSILQTKNQQASGGRLVTGVRPVLPPGIAPIADEILRIVVIGEILSDGERTGHHAAAYVDLLLNP